MSDGMKTYEGMFVLDAGNPDFNAASEPARALLTRCDAEVLSMKPWDERRLAYDIKGRRRGLYVLTYFKADPERIAELERDCQLDERILRLLILRCDHPTEELVNADTPATASAKRAAARKAETDAAEAAQAAKAAEAEGAPEAAAPAAEEAPTAEAAPEPESPAQPVEAPAEVPAEVPAEAAEQAPEPVAEEIAEPAAEPVAEEAPEPAVEEPAPAETEAKADEDEKQPEAS